MVPLGITVAVAVSALSRMEEPFLDFWAALGFLLSFLVCSASEECSDVGGVRGETFFLSFDMDDIEQEEDEEEEDEEDEEDEIS